VGGEDNKRHNPWLERCKSIFLETGDQKNFDILKKKNVGLGELGGMASGGVLKGERVTTPLANWGEVFANRLKKTLMQTGGYISQARQKNKRMPPNSKQHLGNYIKPPATKRMTAGNPKRTQEKVIRSCCQGELKESLCGGTASRIKPVGE